MVITDAPVGEEIGRIVFFINFVVAFFSEFSQF